MHGQGFEQSVFEQSVLHITPPPQPKILVCNMHSVQTELKLLYYKNYCIICNLLKCHTDSKADDEIHAHAHSHNNNKLFCFKSEDTEHQPPRHINHYCPKLPMMT